MTVAVQGLPAGPRHTPLVQTASNGRRVQAFSGHTEYFPNYSVRRSGSSLASCLVPSCTYTLS